MDLENLDGFTLRNVGRINVLLGKNGCGKSFLLKLIEQCLRHREEIGSVRYISPERGGRLAYDPGVDNQISRNLDWLGDQRRKNQAEGFRQQSAALFRRLELLVLRAIEREHSQPDYQPRNFDETVEKLNTLLDRVRIERHNQTAFQIVVRETGEPTSPNEISSGEAELISLGIEVLAFAHDVDAEKENFFLVDEPDVHLHPDLQDRLARFISEALQNNSINLILATHSTALLGGLVDKNQTCVAFMRRGDQNFIFKPATDVDRSILPIFGAHPLSNIFNQAPILLIEGEDDERIWQQAVRSSQGKVRVFPCEVKGNGRLFEYETEVRNIIEAVYDDARGYSLRDRDLDPENIDDVGPVIRMRLKCRTAENLMLSNDALQLAGVDWPRVQEMLSGWVEANAAHQYHAEVRSFVDEGFDRKQHDLKNIRNILIGLMSTKPWEVLVGQAIAQLAINGGPTDEGSLRDFLGQKVCHHLLQLEADTLE